VITMKLLTDSTGKKMGKSEGNMLTFIDSPEEMYGKVMSWTDGMINSGFEMCTRLPETELKKIATELLWPQTNPRDFKMRLAREITALYHGEEGAKKGEKNFTQTFQKHLIPENIQTVIVSSGELLSKVALENNLVGSIGEFKRLIQEGAVTVNEDQKVESFNMVVENDLVVKIGKKRFLKIQIKK